MSYNCLKIFHILSAVLLLTSMAYCYRLWRNVQTQRESEIASQNIQTQTWRIIIPATLIQLATGFTMLSLKPMGLSQYWIMGSVVGFITAIGSWFSFVYFLLLSQQLMTQQNDTPLLANKFKFFRRAQSAMLMLCGFALISMIFLMANRAA